MPIFADARIPVLFAPAANARPGDALLTDADAAAPAGVVVARLAAAAPGHAGGCGCCAPRGPAAAALHRLFLDRARSRGGFFSRLVVSAGPEAEAAIRQALRDDGFLAGRYRL